MGIRTARHDDETPQENHEINVTPFIDVMLVLLIIFMVAAPLATVTVPVQLPASAASAAPTQKPPVSVTLQADRTLSLGEQVVARQALASALQQATQGDVEQRIHLRADRSVVYADLMDVLDALRAAGYLKVALVGVEAPAR